jgi:transposase
MYLRCTKRRNRDGSRVEYKGMWIIESCFKKMKTTGFEGRPMFHWMPQRITAHVKLCVLALMIQRAAELRAEMTWSNIRTALETLKAVTYRTEKQVIVQTTRPTKSASAILKKLNITKPKTIPSVT